MASFKEVAKIVIQGDDAQLQRTLKRAKYQTEKTAEAVGKLGKASAKVFAGLSAASGGLIALYAKQEQAELQVAAAIKQTGKESELTVAQAKEMASQLQATSTYGDEAALAAVNLGLRLGDLSGKQMPRFLRLTADFSTAMGKELPAAAQQLSRYIGSPIEGVTRLAQAGINLDEASKEYIRTLYRQGDAVGAQNALMAELEKRFAGSSQAAIKGTGLIKQTMNTLGDVGEGVGKHLFKAIQPALESFEKFLQSIKNNEGAIKSLADTIKQSLVFAGVTAGVALLAKAILAVKAALIGVSIAAKVAAVAMKAFWATATLGVSLAITGIIEYMGWLDNAEDKLDTMEGKKFVLLDPDAEQPGDAMVAQFKKNQAEITKASETEEEKKARLAKEAHKRKLEREKKQREEEKAARQREAQERRERQVREEEERQRREQERRDLDIENLKTELSNKSELEKQHEIEDREWQLQWNQTLREEDEEAKAQEQERLQLERELMLKKRDEEAKQDLERQKKEGKAKVKNDLEYLREMVGNRSAAGKALFAIQKAIAIKELIMETPARAASAYTITSKAYPYPLGAALGALAYAATWAKGFAAVAQVKNARQGALVEGNPSYGDAYRYNLQAGEAVVPRHNYADIERGIADRLRNEGEVDTPAGQPTEVEVRVDLNEDAGKLFQITQTELDNLGL